MTTPTKTSRRAVLLASGGLDSTVLYYSMRKDGYETTVVFFDYGQHAVDVELATLRNVLPSDAASKIITISIKDIFRESSSSLVREQDLWLGETTKESINLPYRNLVLMASGAAFAASLGVTEMFSAFINSNHATEIDATENFLSYLSSLIGQVGGVSLRMPFRTMSKSQVARLGIELDAPIALTFSCQLNSKVHCGACPNCVDRLEALSSISGIPV